MDRKHHRPPSPQGPCPSRPGRPVIYQISHLKNATGLGSIGDGYQRRRTSRPRSAACAADMRVWCVCMIHVSICSLPFPFSCHPAVDFFAPGWFCEPERPVESLLEERRGNGMGLVGLAGWGGEVRGSEFGRGLALGEVDKGGLFSLAFRRGLRKGLCQPPLPAAHAVFHTY